MSTVFAKLQLEVTCKWEGFPPDYRIYVNDEMLTERTYQVHAPQYIAEVLQIKSVPGEYEIRLEKVSPQTCKFELGKLSVINGAAEVIDNTHFRLI